MSDCLLSVTLYIGLGKLLRIEERMRSMSWSSVINSISLFFQVIVIPAGFSLAFLTFLIKDAILELRPLLPLLLIMVSANGMDD